MILIPKREGMEFFQESSSSTEHRKLCPLTWPSNNSLALYFSVAKSNPQMNNGPFSHKLNPSFSIRNIFILLQTIPKKTIYQQPHIRREWSSQKGMGRQLKTYILRHIINVMPNNYTKVTLKTWFICCPLERKKKSLDGHKNHFISPHERRLWMTLLVPLRLFKCWLCGFVFGWGWSTPSSLGLTTTRPGVAPLEWYYWLMTW